LEAAVRTLLQQGVSECTPRERGALFNVAAVGRTPEGSYPLAEAFASAIPGLVEAVREALPSHDAESVDVYVDELKALIGA